MLALDEPVLVGGEVLADLMRLDLIDLSQGISENDRDAIVGDLRKGKGHKNLCVLGI